MNRGGILVFCGLLAVGPMGCGSDDAGGVGNRVPELRFAGVELVYALRRLAAEADMLIAMDEVNTGPIAPDLARWRVDTDLPEGPISLALDRLKEETGAFDYKILDNLLYIRSNQALDVLTAIDTPSLPATELNVDVEELVRWIMSVRPSSYLQARRTPGEPIFRKVELDVPENGTVLDLLLDYAKKVDRGWHIRRAGHPTTDPHGRAAIVASTVRLWPPLEHADRVPQFRKGKTTLSALAAVSIRTKTPICIKDRSPMGNIQGWLDFATKLDPGYDAEKSVEALAWAGARSSMDDYEYEKIDGVYKLTTRQYMFFLPGRELLDQTVKAGVFEGSLPELTRWLNRNRISPSEKILMGGEITSDAPRARLEIEAGSIMEDVLLEFARVTHTGWNMVLVDVKTPDSPLEEMPFRRWRGAYLTPIADWAPRP